MLDRTHAPAFNTIDSLKIEHAQSDQLENGIPVYCVNGGTQELVRIYEVGNTLHICTKKEEFHRNYPLAKINQEYH